MLAVHLQARDRSLGQQLLHPTGDIAINRKPGLQTSQIRLSLGSIDTNPLLLFHCRFLTQHNLKFLQRELSIAFILARRQGSQPELVGEQGDAL